ncbi:MAG: S26 family signal peptidase [Bacteriovoracaceae bacterium]
MTREEFNQLKQLPLFKGTIVSGSMMPLMPIGTPIVVAVGDQTIKRFDIIVFYNENKLVCHFLWNINRIVTPKLLQSRNLVNFGVDFPISMDDYLGKVVSHKLRLRDKLRLIKHHLFR